MTDTLKASLAHWPELSQSVFVPHTEIEYRRLVVMALPRKGCYRDAVSLNEILEEIPKLSFAERQQLVRRAIEADDDLTPREEAVLEERLKNFRADTRDQSR